MTVTLGFEAGVIIGALGTIFIALLTWACAHFFS